MSEGKEENEVESSAGGWKFVIILIGILLVLSYVVYVNEISPSKLKSVVKEQIIHYRSQQCEHTEQGKRLITDYRGYSCLREHSSNGCCKNYNERFSCKLCTNFCCQDYEYCVSCCLAPSNNYLRKESLLQSKKAYILNSATSDFDYCQKKCRTSSDILVQSKYYPSNNLKYCYSVNITNYNQIPITNKNYNYNFDYSDITSSKDVIDDKYDDHISHTFLLYENKAEKSIHSNTMNIVNRKDNNNIVNLKYSRIKEVRDINNNIEFDEEDAVWNYIELE